ncbi:MAG: NAD-dependent epimerase/dehydratase family protein [Actinomycetota bacterium]|nr:NAD-dependent epimerase/dehydratase family protein [Actinomycetota bacterium]
MGSVVVTGGASALGQRVCLLTADDPAVERVVALDVRTPSTRGPRIDAAVVDLAVDDLSAWFAEADAVVHLASMFGPALDGDELPEGADVVIARRVLDAAAANGVQTVVVLSSATVYGAWPNNVVPLTEDAPLRPNPELRFAVEKAEIERLAGRWREEQPGATIALLRAAPSVAEDAIGWVAKALDAVDGLPAGDDDPPSQFLHLDDLAAAIDTARRGRLDGPLNVAPDKWLEAADRRALAPAPRLRVPERVAVRVATWRWRFGLAPTPPGILPYARYAWVVGNDRLRSAGWQPAHTNEEAFVAGHAAGPLATMSPRRRQELALGAAGSLFVAGVAGVTTVLRRRARRDG